MPKYKMNERVEAQINNAFTYHSPLGGLSGVLIPGVAIRVCEGTKFTVAVTG